MKQQIALIGNRIKNDIKNNGTVILAFAGIFVLFLLVFGDVCPSQILLGMPCPGCGLTRAGILVLRGEFRAAWQLHPFIYAWMYILLYICYKRYVRGGKLKALPAMVILVTVLMFVFYLYRLRYYPDAEPMILQESFLRELLKVWMEKIFFVICVK